MAAETREGVSVSFLSDAVILFRAVWISVTTAVTSFIVSCV
jgi:hypothetical protein